MTTVTVTDQLLHHLVAGSHSEGTTHLAVAAAIEHDDRTLLIAANADDFDPLWQLPADLVLPGETLLDGLSRTVSVTTGLDVVDVTGYAGHHDRLIEGEVVRTFVFTATATAPDRVCRWAGHHWTPEPITVSDITSYLESRPPNIPPAARPIGLTPTQHLCAALRANAKGLLCTEAAVEILINQGSWLQRSDFSDHFIETVTPVDRQLTGDPDMALVDWAAALTALDTGHLPCSSGEARLLRCCQPGRRTPDRPPRRHIRPGPHQHRDRRARHPPRRRPPSMTKPKTCPPPVQVMAQRARMGQTPGPPSRHLLRRAHQRLCLLYRARCPPRHLRPLRAG